MKISTTVDFEFSGCSYHREPPDGVKFDLKDAKAFLTEAGIQSPTTYQTNLYRDLILTIAREVATNLEELESVVREDVRRRRGHEDWSPEAVALRNS